MRHLIFCLIFLAIGLMGFACENTDSAGVDKSIANQTPTPNQTTTDTPTEAYRRLFTAVKAKDTEAIKKSLTKKSQDLAAMLSERNKAPIEKVYENGFTATTFSHTMPEIRDERVKGTNGAVEVWNSKESTWEDLPFVIEDGVWKMAVGELMGGTFQSPGKGLSEREKIAANAMGPANLVFGKNTNTSTNVNAARQRP